MIDLSEIVAADKRAREAWDAGRRDLLILSPRLHAYKPRNPMHSDSPPEGCFIYALPEDVNPKPQLRPLTGEELAALPSALWVGGCRRSLEIVDCDMLRVHLYGMKDADPDWLLANAHYDRELTRPVGREE